MKSSAVSSRGVAEQIYLAVIQERISSLEGTLRDLESRVDLLRDLLLELYHEEIALTTPEGLLA